MRANISITIYAILFHTIRANRKITCETMKHLPIINYAFMQKAHCLSGYISFINILQSMMMNRFIVMLTQHMSLQVRLFRKHSITVSALHDD